MKNYGWFGLGGITVCVILLFAMAIGAHAQGSPTPCPGPIGTLCVNVTWNASTTPGATYNIFRGIGPGKESTTPIATGIVGTLFQDTSVVAGNNYCYVATAHTGGGSSPASNESCALPNPPTVPTTVVATVP
jgi:hypothetical protein